MKTSTVVSVDDELRLAAEGVLAEGESLPDLLQVALRHEIDMRRSQLARSEEAVAEYKRTGAGYSLDAVFDGLRRMTDARRAELEPDDVEAERGKPRNR